jgi:RHS repeat-associated protein
MHALAPIAPAHALPRVRSRAQERLRARGQLWPGATVCKTASKKKISFSRRFPHARCALAQTVPMGNALFPVASLSGKTVGEYGNGGATSSGRTEYIWLPTQDGSAIPVGMFRSNRFYAVHSDHLGTPRLVTDDTAKPVWQWAYSAFGDNKPTGVLKVTTNPNTAFTSAPLLAATNPAVVFNLRHDGQYFDSETGHFQNFHRNYMPGGGRYTQPDPMGLDASMPGHSPSGLTIARPTPMQLNNLKAPPLNLTSTQACNVKCGFKRQWICTAGAVGMSSIASPLAGVATGVGCFAVKTYVCYKECDGKQDSCPVPALPPIDPNATTFPQPATF